MANTIMGFLVMAYTVVAYIVLACVVMAYAVMAYIVMAYIVMACDRYDDLPILVLCEPPTEDAKPQHRRRICRSHR